MIRAEDHTTAWRWPVFHPQRGTPLIVELCCDVASEGTVENSSILEVDPETGEVLRKLLEAEGEITHLDTDPTGGHLLYVLERPRGQGGSAAEPVLFRWSGGDPVALAADALFADW